MNKKEKEFLFKKPAVEEDRPRPLSCFTNEPSVFYNPEHDKQFSNRFQLVKIKGKN